jgi:NitT/TauT family transport system permease protein
MESWRQKLSVKTENIMDLNIARKFEGITSRNQWKHTHWIPLVAVILVLLLWEALVRLTGLPAFILPSPLAVAERFVRALADGSLLRNASVTLLEIVLGLLSGAFSAILIGYAVAKSRLFERIASPFLVASQAVPIVAIAPLLVIWFGQGILSKVLICALIVFFPVLVNTVVGLRAVPRSLNELMRSLRASRWQMLLHLEIPSALPVFLGGLRIGATLSVIGAIVGEFVGADKGLGFLINVGRGQYDTALVFVAVFTLVGLALSLYGIVIYLEHRLLAWQEKI